MNELQLKESNLNEGDVLAMVRLLSNVIARAGGCSEKRHHLLSGFCEIIHADCWVWSLVGEPKAQQPPACLSILEGGPDSEQFASSLHILPSCRPPHLKPSFFSELQRQYVNSTWVLPQSNMRNAQAECDCYLLDSDNGNVPCILSRKAASLNSFSLIGFYRFPEQLPFSERELRLADIILTEVPWLHEKGWPVARATAFSLPPRQRQTLSLLIHGHSRNEIADRLNISVHTVGDYIKAIYSHFDVQSRAELMRRFPSGLPDES